MIKPDTPIEKQIDFYKNKINQYLDVVKNNPKGKDATLHLNNIQRWNREIINLQKQLLQ